MSKLLRVGGVGLLLLGVLQLTALAQAPPDVSGLLWSVDGKGQTDP
jgi:hypothetical protein